MAYDNDYRGLIEDALEAVDKLLDASTHDSWPTLRRGYGDMRGALDRDDAEQRLHDVRDKAARRKREREDRQGEQQRELAEYHERKAAWRNTGRAARESLVLHALADDRLTVSQIAERVDAHFGERHGWTVVHYSHVRPLVMRMLGDGQLERVEDPFQGKVRYRYFRKRGLDGPIADLDRAYRGEAG